MEAKDEKTKRDSNMKFDKSNNSLSENLKKCLNYRIWQKKLRGRIPSNSFEAINIRLDLHSEKDREVNTTTS
jgi:hypothetical protein